MRKIIHTLLIILSIFIGFGNKGMSQTKFQITYGLGLLDAIGGVKSISNGYALAGTSEGFNTYALLILTNDTGLITIQRKYSVSILTPVYVNDIQIANAGSGYMMIGSYGNYAMLLKVDNSGNTLWGEKYGASPDESGTAVKLTSTGSFIIGGSTTGNSMNPDKSSTSTYIFKTNSVGTYLWGRSYTLTTPVFDSYDAVNDVAEASDGYVFAGYNSQNNGADTTTNILVFKTDTNGTLQWMNTYGELAYNEEANSIKVLSNGHLLVAGYTNRTSSGLDQSDVALLELDGSGNLVHSYAYNIGNNDVPGSIQLTSSGGYSIIGSTLSGLTTFKEFLLKLNSSYAPVLAEEYNATLGATAKGEQTSDGGYIIGGGGSTLLLAKTDSVGNSGCNQTSITPAQRTYTPPVTAINPTVHTGGSGSTCSPTNAVAAVTKTVDCMSAPAVLTANAGNNQSFCIGESATIGGSPTASGGTPTYTYLWSPATGLSCTTCINPVASPTITTTYTVTVTDNVSATATSSVLVTVNPLPTIFTVTGGGIYCSGGAGVVVGLNGSQSGVSYQLQVGSVNTGSPVAGTGSAISFGNQTAVGTYTVIATNSTTTCTNSMTGSVTININPLPTAYSLTGGGSYCIGGSGNVVGLSGSDAGTTYQLQVNSVNTGTPVSGTGSSISFGNQTTVGIYTVVATITSTGCINTMTGSVTISINPLPTAYNLTGGGSFCIGGSGSAIGLSGSDNGVNYQLQLGGTNTGSPVAGTGSAISFGNHIFAGTYTVIATNTSTGCTDTMTGTDTITINPLPNPNLSPNASTCLGHGVNIYATAGLVSYVWSPITGLSCTNCSNPVASPTDTTTYSVTVTDINGCSNTGNITVYVYTAPPANAGSNVTICKGSSTTLTATGGGVGGTYLWRPALGLSSTSIASPTANPTINTLYTVTVTDVAGCSATANVTVSINPLPVANAGRDTSICIGQSTTLNASGGVSYSWSPSATLSNANIFNPVASPTFTTIYTVTVTDINGCSNTSHVTVTINNLPTADAGSNVSICEGESTMLNASGGSSYTWSPVTGLSSSNISNPEAAPTATTTYTVTVANSGGCTASASVVVTVNPLPVPNAGNDTTICSGHSTTLTASGGTSYLWYPTTGLSSSTSSNPIATPTVTTHYNVVVTNSFGCTTSTSITVNVNNSPIATAGPDTSICSGNAVTLNATGGGSYQWNTTDTGATVTYVPIVTSTYIVTVSYSNGCISTAGVLVTVNPTPAITLTKDPTGFAYVGQIVSFTALPEGYSDYNFYVNNILVQSGSNNIYQTNSFANNNPVVSVTVSENDCTSAVDTINVEIKPIPNAFIPEGDDILNKNFVPGLNLTIINRWGQKLYEGTDGWDGKYNGTYVSPGTYFYVIKLTDMKNQVNDIKGSVTVVENKK